MFTDAVKDAVKTCSLADAAIGGYACLNVTAEGDDAVRLKRLGICQGRPLELISLGNPMILRVSGARIGLSRQLAEKIQIDTIPCLASHASPSSIIRNSGDGKSYAAASARKIGQLLGQD